MKKFIFFFLFYLILSACSYKGEKGSESMPTEVAPALLNKDTIVVSPDSGSIYLTLTNGRSSIQIYKKSRKQVLLDFENSGYAVLKGIITTQDSTANIRFNQIIMPNGEMDGPFGREIEYKLAGDGQYYLVLGESLMAGDPWEGNFNVEITLSNP